VLVGRRKLLADILSGAVDRPRVDDLWGSLGAGKTSILRNLKDNAPGLSPIFVDMGEFNPGHRGESGDQASIGAVQASFQQFSLLLKDLIRRTGISDALARFEDDIISAHNADVLGRRIFSLEESMAELKGDLRPKDLADAWRAAADTIADAFVSYWNRPTGEGYRLLLLDNIDEVTDQEIGIWLGRLLPRLQRTVAVITQERDGDLWWLPKDSVSVRLFPLPSFDIGEVKAYLKDVAQVSVPDHVAKNIYQISGGHAATLVVIYRLLWQSGVKASVIQDEVLKNLPDSQDEKVAELVKRLVKRLNNRAMTQALWAVAVPRRFDAGFVRFMLTGSSLSDEEVEDVFRELGKLPFAEALYEDRSLLRIHPYVRHSLLEDMRRFNRDRFNALHQRAADYYSKEVLTKEGGRSPYRYGDAFIYEDPEWQRSKREWLYHQGHASEDDAKRGALLDFARVFLDAFWWWANYVHFDFCDQLVADLDNLAKRRRVRQSGSVRQASAFVEPDKEAWPELELLHLALRRVLRGYPPRSMKRKDADWDDVRDALFEVQNLCGLRDKPGRGWTEDQKHVAALLDIFLAHTWRYQGGELSKADKCYERAAARMDKEKDWSWPWIAFERADLYFERNEIGAVRDLWLDAARLVQPFDVDADEEGDDEPDDELTSNLHRLRGDCCWSGGDRLRAATWYGRAVLHAYLFHFAGDPPDNCPDEYTLQFYVDTCARVLGRLFALQTLNEHDTALDCAQEMARVVSGAFGEAPRADRTELKRLLEEQAPLPLSRAMFPRAPEVLELERAKSRFTSEFWPRYDSLDLAAVYSDLHDEIWP
jgi:hypothetical protein